MKYDQKQTEKWIKGIKKGDEYAYREFYEYWYPRCFYIALAIMRNEADAKDAAQESMIEVHKSIQHLRDIKYFKLWLNRIVASKCNRIYRKKKESTMSVKEDTRLENICEERSYLIPDKASHITTDEEVLQQLLTHLSYHYREILTLMYFEHMSIKEIAACLAIPEGTVKSRLSSAKARLREEILGYEAQTGIPLDFKESTLDAVLATSFMSYLAKHKQGIVMKPSPLAKQIALLHGKSLMIAMGCTGLVAGGAFLYQAYQAPQSQSSPSAIQRQMIVHEFPPMEFKNMEVANAKDAYFVLKKYAHCEYERSQLSEKEQEDLEEMERILSEYSSVYTDLYKNQK